MRLTLIAALMLALPATLSTAAAYAATNAATLLTASTPEKNASGKELVERVALNFAEEVELYNVTLYQPYGNELVLFETDYAPDTPKKTGRDFSFALPAALTEPGNYKISYLLGTKSIKSLNGFIDFTIEPKYPAPSFASNPGPDEELAVPLTQIVLQLDQKVDLILLDLNKVTMQGDEVGLIPVQNFMDGSTPETSVRNDSEFTFPLITPLSEPGEYMMSYSYTVTNEDGSISPFTGMVNFTVK
jgi:methionine-rich copper-binding protein CopC